MIKAHDIYILLALSDDQNNWTYASLSQHLGIAQSELHRALKRASTSHLYNDATRQVKRTALIEFITHGLRYAFATTPGQTQRGYPTGWDAPGLDEYMTEDPLEVYIWPHPAGTHRGRAIESLHNADTELIVAQQRWHQLLALCDVIRLGGARERYVASNLIKEMLSP